MSSLAATQADGYYLPSEYYDSGLSKRGVTKNQFVNSKGHNQFIQNGVVRFELPYKGICKKCLQSIGRGTRYNAKKIKSSEMYFTTQIWDFQLTCHNCSNQWLIRTNPKERGFDYIEGITIQKGQQSIVNEEDDISLFLDDKSSAALDRLASEAHGHAKALTEHEQLLKLQQLNNITKFVDSDTNAFIRTKFRSDRKEKRQRLNDANKLGWSSGMELLSNKTNLHEQIASKEVVYGIGPQHKEQQKFSYVRQSSIFTTKTKTNSSTTRSSKKQQQQQQRKRRIRRSLPPNPDDDDDDTTNNNISSNNNSMIIMSASPDGIISNNNMNVDNTRITPDVNTSSNNNNNNNIENPILEETTTEINNNNDTVVVNNNNNNKTKNTTPPPIKKKRKIVVSCSLLLSSSSNNNKNTGQNITTTSTSTSTKTAEEKTNTNNNNEALHPPPAITCNNNNNNNNTLGDILAGYGSDDDDDSDSD